MFSSRSGRARLGRVIWTGALAALCSAGLAAAASAASLHVRVTPSRLKLGASYLVRLTGTFSHKEVHGKAYLIAAIQFSSKPCAATAQAENLRNPDFYFETKKQPLRVGLFESSPFTLLDSLTPSTSGPRRICGYLYAKKIAADSTTLPIARGSQLIHVTKQ